MIGIYNRLNGVPCEVGTCLWTATHTELVTVIPGNPRLKDERHAIDVVLCQRHDETFGENGLIGVVTAHGDTITESSR